MAVAGALSPDDVALNSDMDRIGYSGEKESGNVQISLFIPGIIADKFKSYSSRKDIRSVTDCIAFLLKHH